MEYTEINCIYSEKSSIAHDKACRYAKVIDEKLEGMDDVVLELVRCKTENEKCKMQ